MYYAGVRPRSRCAALFTCALSRSKESLPRQVIGSCLHCLWHTPPPLLDTSVVFIRAEELCATLLSNLQSQGVHSASSSLSSWISARHWENQKCNLNRCSNSNVNLKNVKNRWQGSQFIRIIFFLYISLYMMVNKQSKRGKKEWIRQ